jgi:hypothetical protein
MGWNYLDHGMQLSQLLLAWPPEIGPGLMRVLIHPDWARDSTKKRTRHTPEQIIRKLYSKASVKQ